MEDVNIIFNNDFGVSFTWKHPKNEMQRNIIAVLFNNTVLHFTKRELVLFSNGIVDTITNALPSLDRNYAKTNTCKSLILNTPFPKISFAMSPVDLLAVEDLIKGTLFEMGLHSLLKDITSFNPN